MKRIRNGGGIRGGQIRARKNRHRRRSAADDKRYRQNSKPPKERNQIRQFQRDAASDRRAQYHARIARRFETPSDVRDESRQPNACTNDVDK